MTNDNEFLKKCLTAGGQIVSDKLLDELISLGEIKIYSPKDQIIEPGEINKSVFIISSGFTKTYYFDGKKEYVTAFSGVGTIFLSALIFLTPPGAASPVSALTKGTRRTRC